MEIQIRIKMERPRWARLPRTRWARVGLALVVALVVAVPFAWANDRFADVPASSPHHNDISAIATAGITRGCNPPANTLYCPADPVRRDQMASFITRSVGQARLRPAGRPTRQPRRQARPHLRTSRAARTRARMPSPPRKGAHHFRQQ